MITTVSVHSKIFEAIFRAKEKIDSEYEDTIEWITDITNNSDRPKYAECEICSSNKKLEQHHVRGRKHGNECITVCLECHKTLTGKQRLWDRSWLNTDAEDKDPFLIHGLIDICVLKYFKTDYEIYQKIADILTEVYSYE